MAEWSNVPDSKSGVGANLPWVRIPPSPPLFSLVISYRRKRLKKLILLCSLVLMGCDQLLQNTFFQGKKDAVYWCKGDLLTKKIINENVIDSRLTVDMEYNVKLLRSQKQIIFDEKKVYPICLENKHEIIFYPTCDFSSHDEKLPNSNFKGTLNKINGKLTYRTMYDTNNITNISDLSLICDAHE